MSGDRAAGGRPIAVHLLPGASQHGHLLRHQRRWVWLEGTAWRQALDRHLPAWRTDARPPAAMKPCLPATCLASRCSATALPAADPWLFIYFREPANMGIFYATSDEDAH